MPLTRPIAGITTIAGTVLTVLVLAAAPSDAPKAREAVAALPSETVLTYDLMLGGFGIGSAEVSIALPPPPPPAAPTASPPTWRPPAC